MKHPKSKDLWEKFFLFFGLALFHVLGLLGCGVKDSPSVPELPPSLGRGRPDFKRAAQKVDLNKGSESKDSGQDEKSEAIEDEDKRHEFDREGDESSGY